MYGVLAAIRGSLNHTYTYKYKIEYVNPKSENQTFGSPERLTMGRQKQREEGGSQ